MRGHLRPVKGRTQYWELVVEAPRDPVTKKRRQVRRGFRGTKALAERALRDLAREIDDGKHRDTDATLATLLERWLDNVGDDLSPTTAREYRRLVKKRISPVIGKTTLRALDAATLDAFYAGLRREKLSPSTIRQTHAIIRRALNQALKWDWIDANVALKASPPSVRKKELSPPSPNGVERLIGAATVHNPAFAAFIALAARTGARRGELCALRWSNIDVAERALLIAKSYAVVDGVGYLKDTKTHAARRIGLGPVTLAIVEEHMDAMTARAAACETPLDRDPFLFSFYPDCSHPWNPDYATAEFRRLRDKVGLTVRLHDLRHMHATELGAKGVPIRTIAGRLGHAQTSTTLNMYSHFLEASDQEAAEVIDEILAPALEVEASS